MIVAKSSVDIIRRQVIQSTVSVPSHPPTPKTCAACAATAIVPACATAWPVSGTLRAESTPAAVVAAGAPALRFEKISSPRTPAAITIWANMPRPHARVEKISWRTMKSVGVKTR